jgi:uncharacterized metal-binding protein YceD (DUF177 family)
LPTIFQQKFGVKSEFEIQFGALSVGDHIYQFIVDEEFFATLESSLVKDGNIIVDVRLHKTDTHLNLFLKSEGKVRVECDVCLSELDYPIFTENELLVKFTSEPQPFDDEIIYLGFEDYKLELKQHIYDFVMTSMPMKKICSDSLNRKSCDEKVVAIINNQTGIQDDLNPEWNKLKELFKKK